MNPIRFPKLDFINIVIGLIALLVIGLFLFVVLSSMNW